MRLRQTGQSNLRLDVGALSLRGTPPDRLKRRPSVAEVRAIANEARKSHRDHSQRVRSRRCKESRDRIRPISRVRDREGVRAIGPGGRGFWKGPDPRPKSRDAFRLRHLDRSNGPKTEANETSS